MKVRIIISIIGGVVILLAGWSGYFYGLDSGKKIGYNEGFEYGKYFSYEQGYTTGYDNGKEFVVSHLGQYVTIPKAVSYDEVVAFIDSDQTDINKYTDEFDCVSFTRILRDSAIKDGIKCGIATFNLKNTYDGELVGHAINAFETTDRGIVYFDPQTDGERFDIRVGGTYKLSEVYKITKVDIIW